VHAAEAVPVEEIFAAAKSLQPKVVAWRRDIHANPELGNQEVRTAKLVADQLKVLGLEVKTGVAVTGVVGVLRGGKPGGVVALRADMDALPVQEKTGLAIASTKTAVWDGKTVPVAHVCGHDAHVAMLMGAAEILAAKRAEIPGTIKFIFQPAEEGGLSLGVHGAKLMVREGVLDNPAPTAVFGLHIGFADSGKLLYRSGKFLAASDRFKIQLSGQGTHGAAPWRGTDLISLASEIVLAFNTMAARQVNVVDEPSIVTVGMIHGGTRNNVIADTLEMEGTVRTFTPDRRKDVLARIERIVSTHAAAYGAKAVISFDPNAYPPTINDATLVANMLPALKLAAGDKGILEWGLLTGAEDFSHFAERIPGFYYFLGAGDPKTPLAERPGNHAPNFTIDEAAMETGVRAHAIMAWSYLALQADRNQ
jgi:amidohydrolase